MSKHKSTHGGGGGINTIFKYDIKQTSEWGIFIITIPSVGTMTKIFVNMFK